MEELIGTITEDGRFVDVDGKKFTLPIRGEDDEGYPEVLIEAKCVGGQGWMYRQSSKPFIGMKVSFMTNNGIHGFNFDIIKDEV